MFSGIIRHQGQITDLTPAGTGYTCWLDIPDFDCALGDSIAINGICSTVAALSGTRVQIAYLSETKKRTTLSHWQVGDYVNIEPSLRLSDRIHGHFVTGHVDTIAHITDITPDTHWQIITLTYPERYYAYAAEKGSITLNGVGLTIVSRTRDDTKASLTVHLVPHSVDNTTFRTASIGDAVNLEVDMMARYIQQLYAAQ